MGGQFAPAFGGFMNDQTAQMGLQVGQKAFLAGQEAMEQSVCRYCPARTAISGSKRDHAHLLLQLDQSLRLCVRLETLLQRINVLCPP